MSVEKPCLFILDVGHGNSAVLIDTKGNVVVDSGPGNALYLFLKKEGIEKIDVILISHADQDHIGGLIGIVASEEFIIGKVRVNSDALQGSKTWDDLLYTLNHGQKTGQIDFDVSLSTKDTGKFDQGKIHIEILSPNLYIAGKSPGSYDRKKRKLTTNSISAVIRLTKDGSPVALLSGDIDDTGLLNLLEENVDPCSPIAVFPHHGGSTGKGTDSETFTKKVCESIRPEVVIFSIGRGEHITPREEITETIRRVLPKTRIMCTELSENCAPELRLKDFPHLETKFAKGKEKGKCCAGTIVIELDKDKPIVKPEENKHKAFIEKAAPTSLCLRRVNSRTSSP